MQVIIVGCGHMGGAMLEGWLASHIVTAEDAHVIAPRFPLKNLGNYSKTITFPQHKDAEIAELVANDKFNHENTMIVMAVRPQIMKDVLPSYKAFTEKNIPFMTVAAGLRESFYRQILGEKAAIIRVMPNMPTSIGRGMNAIFYNENCTETIRKNSKKLMQPLGEVDILQSEEEMDVFTALAGSGPAYLFLLVETMAQAAVKLGFEPERAERLALETVLGSAEYMKDVELNSQTLREKIALPGGTTEQAIAQLLHENALPDLMYKALQAASQRSKAMSEEMAK